jgi:hypothetical protein
MVEDREDTGELGLSSDLRGELGSGTLFFYNSSYNLKLIVFSQLLQLFSAWLHRTLHPLAIMFYRLFKMLT